MSAVSTALMAAAQPVAPAAGTSAGQAAVFWICAVVAVIAAVGMVVSPRTVHSALMLALVMICLAALYAVQQAPFLAFVQIIVYTGAVVMLFLFVLMLVGVDSSDSLVETIRGQRVWAGLAGLGFAVLLVGGLGNAVTREAVGLARANASGNVQGLARLLFTKYVFAFEATAALLITAALGAMVLAHRERIRPRATQQELSTQRFRGPWPSPLPSPGFYARHNAVDMPGLLPDGSTAPESVPASIASQGERGVEERDGRERPLPPDQETGHVPPEERDELDLPEDPGKRESR